MQEDDYMSDAFLEELKDVRPGLLNREAKRKAKAPQQTKSKKIKVIENEAREKGLSLPISTGNKGFALMQKMGYKEGMSLGKSGDGQTSLIPLVVKDGKTGLGRTKYVAEKASKRKSEVRVQEEKNLSDFRLRKTALVMQRKFKSDLRMGQMACHQLDAQHGLTTPVENWYWPEELVPKVMLEEEEGEEEGEGEGGAESDSGSDRDEDLELECEEQLKKLTDHLRSSYFYCIWCGTAYQDGSDLEVNCPGNIEEAHD